MSETDNAIYSIHLAWLEHTDRQIARVRSDIRRTKFQVFWFGSFGVAEIALGALIDYFVESTMWSMYVVGLIFLGCSAMYAWTWHRQLKPLLATMANQRDELEKKLESLDSRRSEEKLDF